MTQVPEECQEEMTQRDLLNSLVSISNVEKTPNMSQVICPERFSSPLRLFRVTALVLRFANKLRGAATSTVQPEAEEIQRAKLMWMRHMQVTLPDHKDFPAWKQKLGLFQDEDGVWRCGGRMLISCLTPSAQNPILLGMQGPLFDDSFSP